jgi:NAD(P)H-hydrate epimerase
MAGLPAAARCAVPWVLGARAAAELDAELMRQPGFSLDQLMELAGLSVACAVAAVWPLASRLLVVCGPGNNGGDGLVASRHLAHFGFRPVVLYPKEPREALYVNLLQQVRDLDVAVWRELPGGVVPADEFDGLVDAVFGFSFNPAGGVRAPFDGILRALAASSVPIASVDIPSGWDVEQGDLSGTGLGLQPHMLISLTAPKPCALRFQGQHHFLGGRFLPPHLARKFGLTGLPRFPGTDQCVRLPVPLAEAASWPDECKI